MPVAYDLSPAALPPHGMTTMQQPVITDLDHLQQQDLLYSSSAPLHSPHQYYHQSSQSQQIQPSPLVHQPSPNFNQPPYNAFSAGFANNTAQIQQKFPYPQVKPLVVVNGVPGIIQQNRELSPSTNRNLLNEVQQRGTGEQQSPNQSVYTSLAQQKALNRPISASIPTNAAIAGGHLTKQLSAGTPPKQVKASSIEQQQLAQLSRTSPSELSPGGGYVDSPHSTTFSQSELDDIIIDEILSLENEQQNRMATHAQPHDVSSSCPTSSLELDALLHKEAGEGKEGGRDRRKKDIHNMIERRRRYNINDRIKELGQLLPKYTECATDEMKLNKGTILKASVDYIKQTQKEREHWTRVQQRQHQYENKHSAYLSRIKELENQLQMHGLAVPDQPALSPSPMPQSQSQADLLIGVKQEPVDDQTPPSYDSQGLCYRTPPDHSFNAMAAMTSNVASTSLYSPPSRAQQPSSTPLITPPVLHSNAHAPLFDAQDPLGHPQQHRPGGDGLSDLMMMDMTGELARPGVMLGSGDPMISAGIGQGQVSPDVTWDSSTMSPDHANNRMDMN